ncbi:hypothetical protein FJZ53_00180 [Candidatus Woesearchaeota archaeon]|nr:hypothetical protein [Candidatus Woesearchaeota archaeon]
MKNLNKNELEDLINNISYGIIAMPENHDALIEEEYVLGKKILKLDALSNKELANAYWKLDSNAFDNQPAPIFMKLDALILGGCPILMMLPKEKTDPQLVKCLEAENLDYIPIGFLDLHKIENGKFTASGLGIAKPYQGKGLSKYMIYGGAKIAGIKELYIPTQLSNKQVQLAWAHLAPLEIVSSNVFHNKPDTVIYKTKIPEIKEEILKPIINCYSSSVP